jgi:hypothetical protein
MTCFGCHHWQPVRQCSIHCMLAASDTWCGYSWLLTESCVALLVLTAGVQQRALLQHTGWHNNSCWGTLQVGGGVTLPTTRHMRISCGGACSVGSAQSLLPKHSGCSTVLYCLHRLLHVVFVLHSACEACFRNLASGGSPACMFIHSFMLHLWQKLIQATPTHSRRRQLPKLTN